MKAIDVSKRRAVAAALDRRRRRLEKTAMASVGGVGARPGLEDAQYLQGLELAISAAVDFGLQQLDVGCGIPVEVPSAVLAQARLAARYEVSVETVLRRYVAGYSVFVGYVMEEACRCTLTQLETQGLISEQTTAFEDLLAAVSAEYENENGFRRFGSEVRRIQRLRRLLDGDVVGTDDLAYPFAGYNLAVVARGAAVERQLRHAAEATDRAVLTVRAGGEVVWGWLGGQREFTRQEHQAIPTLVRVEGTTIALGEPCPGLEGWRLSHKQARAALVVAEEGAEPIVRYADVAVVASAQRDRLLASSLQAIYLAPLEGERDGGAKLRSTLRAYIDSGRNISAAASALGVSRRTVTNRIECIEEKLGRSIALAGPALDTALRLHALAGNGGIGSTVA